jgi:hypothetical protein
MGLSCTVPRDDVGYRLLVWDLNEKKAYLGPTGMEEFVDRLQQTDFFIKKFKAVCD